MADLPINFTLGQDDPMSKLPPELMLRLISHMDEREIFKMAMAFPDDWIRGNKVQIAELDGQTQSQFAPSEGQIERVPWAHTAMQYDECPLWFIQELLRGLVWHCPKAINGLYEVPRQLLTPLHMATICGRADVVEYLLQYPGINHWMRCNNVLGRNECQLRNRTHAGACQFRPDLPVDRRNGCATAAEAAVYTCAELCTPTSTKKLRETHFQDVEECALLLLAYGIFEPPSNPPALKVYRHALYAAMMRYPVAVLRRTVGLPLENEDRRRLFQDNFRAVFLAASREDSGRPIIQYLTDLAETGTENGEYIFPLPTINDLQDRLRNPISGAADRDLTPSGAEDAAYMLRLLRGPLLRYTQDPALYATFMILNLVELESVHFDVHEAVFKEIFNYVHDFIFTLPVERLDANMRQNFVYLLDSIFEAAINCQFAEGNTFWAVQHFGYRYGTANYLRIATGTRNAPLFNIILAQMCIDKVSLDDPIPFHDFTGIQWRQETILFTCIESRNLVGVLELLHAGADPGTAPRSAWLNLSQELDWLKNYMYREQIVEHLKTYFCLERVGDVSDSTLAWLRLIHQIAREHAGLDPLAPHDQISLDEGYYADDERSFDQDDSSGDGDDDGDIVMD